MKTHLQLGRRAAMAAFAGQFVAGAMAASKRSRVYNATFDSVWNAATGVANDLFSLEMHSKQEGKVRFRTKPLPRYRFEAVIIDAGGRRIRVDLELRTNLYGMEKDAWRNGDKYLASIEQRLHSGDVR